jgi:predicted Zn-ribbon and HTH transcriptional regulator
MKIIHVIENSGLTELHMQLAIAYQVPRNLSQVGRALDQELGKVYHQGRHIIPYTQNLEDWGYIQRVNPGACKSAGYIFQTTALGKQIIAKYYLWLEQSQQEYYQSLDALSKRTKYGF